MSTSNHYRSSSSETSSSNGSSSHQLILDHILTYPGTYELPLRTMYTLNCVPRAQPMPTRSRNGSESSSNDGSPINARFPWAQDPTTQQFTTSLMAELSQIPDQPTSLPPSFVTSFVRKCFAPELKFVDFPQSLTSLDYLKDLETRRRREVATALKHLDINRDNVTAAEEDLPRRFPGVVDWFRSIENKERTVEALYTQLYVGLRRWIMINELSLTPFNKHNAIAMLNTLYPPVMSTPPTSKLTPTIMHKQRDGFFRYIQGVERSGPKILANLMGQGRKPGSETGWGAVRDTLDQYLQVANSIIRECSEIVAMGHDVRAQRSSTDAAQDPTPVSRNMTRALTSVPSDRTLNDMSRQRIEGQLYKGDWPNKGGSSTTLEKIARELKSMGRGRIEATESSRPSTADSKDSKSLRKIRSLGNLGGLRKTNSSATSLSPRQRQSPVFDAGEMKRQRLIYEANANKGTLSPVTTFF